MELEAHNLLARLVRRTDFRQRVSLVWGNFLNVLSKSDFPFLFSYAFPVPPWLPRTPKTMTLEVS